MNWYCISTEILGDYACTTFHSYFIPLEINVCWLASERWLNFYTTRVRAGLLKLRSQATAAAARPNGTPDRQVTWTFVDIRLCNCCMTSILFELFLNCNAELFESFIYGVLWLAVDAVWKPWNVSGHVFACFRRLRYVERIRFIKSTKCLLFLSYILLVYTWILNYGL